VLPKVGEKIGDLETGLPVPLEFAARTHEFRLVDLDLRERVIAAQETCGNRLAVQSVKHGLGIEGIDLARTALHEEKNHALGLCRKMRRLLSQGIRGRRDRRGERVALKQIRQRERAYTETGPG
jgi:hypothetical protein